MKLGAQVFGALSAALLLFLLLGLLLPGTWKAEAAIFVPAPPSAVFPLINRLTSWGDWTPIPETGLEAFGAAEGVGAGLRWDDPQYGSGETRIVGSRQDAEVEYEVEVEGGALKIRGSLFLEPEEAGTRIRWVEEGDFGWNPLMGYATGRMASSQEEAMRESLGKLAEEAVKLP